jgi:hypothetical protein
VKTNLFASILLSALLYTNLLSTTFVRDEAGMTTAAGRIEVWERSANAPAKLEPHRDLRPRRTDATIDKTCGPDAAMIKPGKARGKSIKV